MQLLQGRKISLVLYYKQITTKGGYQKLVVLDNKDEKDEEEIKKKMEAEKDLPDSEKTIFILNTKWKVLSWKEVNDITRRAQIVTNGIQELDYFLYRDLRLKTALVEWDITSEKGEAVPVSPSTIDLLPSDIVYALISQYDEAVNLSDDDEKKV